MSSLRNYILEKSFEIDLILFERYLDLQEITPNDPRGPDEKVKKKLSFFQKLKIWWIKNRVNITTLVQLLGAVSIVAIFVSLSSGRLSRFNKDYDSFEKEQEQKRENFNDWFKKRYNRDNPFGRSERSYDKTYGRKNPFEKSRGSFTDQERAEAEAKARKFREEYYKKQEQERQKAQGDFWKGQRQKEKRNYSSMSPEVRAKHERLDTLLEQWMNKSGRTEGEIQALKNIINTLARNIGRDQDVVESILKMLYRLYS